MGRELKRVPLDFDWEIDKIWYGYKHIFICGDCEDCKKFAQLKGQTANDDKCPIFPEIEALKEPPKGDGYQLWETTTEGSPKSPVFSTLDELCEWCETNATTFSTAKVTKEKWKEMLSAGKVYHKEGCMMFI